MLNKNIPIKMLLSLKMLLMKASLQLAVVTAKCLIKNYFGDILSFFPLKFQRLRVITFMRGCENWL